jgi:hypothetical protein
VLFLERVINLKRLPEYKIKINGNYLRGYDDQTTVGKTGHMGWHPQANELTALVLTPYETEAMVIEGNISLKSQFDRIYDRMRYGGLMVKSLSIEEVLKCAVCSRGINDDEHAYCYSGADAWFCEDCKREEE